MKAEAKQWTMASATIKELKKCCIVQHVYPNKKSILTLVWYQRCFKTTPYVSKNWKYSWYHRRRFVEQLTRKGNPKPVRLSVIRAWSRGHTTQAESKPFRGIQLGSQEEDFGGLPFAYLFLWYNHDSQGTMGLKYICVRQNF
jgi:hypothetical protein